jgi:hypothetical protein
MVVPSDDKREQLKVSTRESLACDRVFGFEVHVLIRYYELAAPRRLVSGRSKSYCYKGVPKSASSSKIHVSIM